MRKGVITASMFWLLVLIIVAIILIFVSFPVFGKLIEGGGEWIMDFFTPEKGGGF